MPFHFSPIYFIHYLLKREATQFFTSIAIRKLALGMVLIFEPIYLFLFFNKSLHVTVLFFAAVHLLYALLVVWGGKIMARIGIKHSILLSHLFFWAYYLALFFIDQSYLLVILAITLKAAGMSLFWPAFHVDFCRFSEKSFQGKQVGKLNVAVLIPAIISPLIGGWVLASFGYHALFAVVIIVLFASSIPMFLSRESHVVYSDSFGVAWKRIFKKVNKKTNIAFASSSIEWGISIYCWPLFMFVLALGYGTMGGITTFSLAMSIIFAMYIGKLSDRMVNRIKLLNWGSILTSISWIVKYFVNSPLSALSAHALYRICRTTASIPFETFLYTKASLRGAETDEFIIYREILVNVSRGLFLIFLAGFFLIFPKVNLSFFMAAIVSLGMMFLGVPPKILKKSKWISIFSNK